MEELFGFVATKMLRARGIETKEDALNFFEPKYEDGLHDPFLLTDMLRAVMRILDAINNKERIVIYADYDCDGIPGATIINDFFKKIGFDNFEVYIPHRQNEGYGMNIEAVRTLASRGTDLIITVDSGITDFEPINEARKLGLCVIVTDHHETKETLPDAYAVINPKRADDNYPNKGLSGSGVAFKLVQALVSFGNFRVENGWEKWLLDLASIGTIADMVPLTGENRVIARFGLCVLKKTKRIGLQNLFRKLKIENQRITEEDIGFSIGPRINAASRMGVPSVAFKFISTTNEEEAIKSLNYLEKKNNDRKKLVGNMMKESELLIKDKDSFDVIVIGKDDWTPGVAGLVANKLVDIYGKMSFVWGREGKGKIKGSCRSNGNVSLVDIMSSVDKEILCEYGGHHMAGGFSITDGRVADFEKHINESYLKIKDLGLIKNKNEIPIEAILKISDIDWELYSILEKMAPFGVGNPKPVFILEGLEIQRIRKFGKNSEHLEMGLTDGEKDISAYDFYINENSFSRIKIEEGRIIDIVAKIEKNTYGRFPSLRLRIVDVKNPKCKSA